MEFDRTGVQRRRAISGILAAILLFAMLFTVGTGYFLFVNANNQFYDAALVGSSSALQNRISENLMLTTLKLSDNHIGVYANNTGGIGVNMTGLYLAYSGKSVTKCMGVGLPSSSCTISTSFPSCQFPVYVNLGKGTRGIPSTNNNNVCTGSSSTIDTGQPANSTTAVIRVITQRGSVFTATYPPTATALAAQALSSGAIGDLYLNFQSYSWYDIVQGGTCPSGGSNSGYCLQYGGSAFSIPYNVGNIGFSVSLTDYNPSQLNITLDRYSLLLQIIESGSGALKNTYWYIVSISNQTNSVCSGSAPNTICSQFSKITLQYNIPITVVFMSAGWTSVSPQTNGLSNSQEFSTAPAFIVTHGWKGVALSKQVTSNSNFGQNSPYVTTLYY